jgi:hypothetical protein
MNEHKATRTLVKSPPELWAELSDETSLANHLSEPFGEIRITRLEPESAVAWEGERACGTVRIEPSGWGTRVILTAQAVQGTVESPVVREQSAVAPEPVAVPAVVPEPPVARHPAAPSQPPAVPGPPAPKPGLFARLFGRFGGKREAGPEPESPQAAEPDPAPAPARASAPDPLPAPIEPAPAPAAPAEIDHTAVLVAVLDRLGSAHHRPFSR